MTTDRLDDLAIWKLCEAGDGTGHVEESRVSPRSCSPGAWCAACIVAVVGLLLAVAGLVVSVVALLGDERSSLGSARAVRPRCTRRGVGGRDRRGMSGVPVRAAYRAW